MQLRSEGPRARQDDTYDACDSLATRGIIRCESPNRMAFASGSAVCGELQSVTWWKLARVQVPLHPGGIVRHAVPCCDGILTGALVVANYVADCVEKFHSRPCLEEHDLFRREEIESKRLRENTFIS